VKIREHPPSAQAEIRENPWAPPISASWNSWKSVKFVGKKPHQRKLKTFVQIRVIRGRNPISASWNIRENSCNSWKKHQRKL